MSRSRRRSLFLCAIAVGAASVTACGSDDVDTAISTPVPTTEAETASETESDTEATDADPAGVGADPRPAAAEATQVTAIEQPASSDEPADRITDPFVVTWIGGSEVVLEDRSLPDAVGRRIATVDGRDLHLVADTQIGPLPGEIAERVELAARRGADALIVTMNPSWVRSDGSDDCAGLTPPHAFYECLLTPPPATVVTRLRADVAALVDTIVDTGLPSYLYVMSHSDDSLAAPRLGDLIDAAIADLTATDPGVAHVRFVRQPFGADLADMNEGDEFFDMVHPTTAGVERLAELFATELARFWSQT